MLHATDKFSTYNTAKMLKYVSHENIITYNEMLQCNLLKQLHACVREKINLLPHARPTKRKVAFKPIGTKFRNIQFNTQLSMHRLFSLQFIQHVDYLFPLFIILLAE